MKKTLLALTIALASTHAYSNDLPRVELSNKDPIAIIPTTPATPIPSPYEDTAKEATPAGNAIKNNEQDERIESNWKYANQRDAAQDRHFTGRINDLHNQLDDVEEKAYDGIALAIAMSTVPQALQEDTTTIGFGGGSYEGSTGMAFGLSHRFQRVTLNLKVGSTGDNTGFGAGVGYSF